MCEGEKVNYFSWTAKRIEVSGQNTTPSLKRKPNIEIIGEISLSGAEASGAIN